MVETGMRLFGKYLWQRRRIWLVGAVFCGIFALSFHLYHLPAEAALYPALLCGGLGLVLAMLDFMHVKRRHEALQRIESIADIAAGSLSADEGILGEDYQALLRLLQQEHGAYCTAMDVRYGSMIDYYTVWAHQIKTPISAMRLRLQGEDTPLSRRLMGDLRRIEQYVEMVLAFLRLDSRSTDYLIREYDLDKIVRQAVRRLSSEFIDRGLRLCYQPLEASVVTDEKWLCFVVEQLLSNALKYTPAGSITISMKAGMPEKKILCISDTGIGIAPEDLPRIFENGFTGCNGRKDKSASGLGLYLCRRICTNLGHGISAFSVPDEGTTIEIDLSQRRLEIE